MVNQAGILFDPVQYKEFGLGFYQGDGFNVRFQTHKKFFLRSMYIPYGPVCESLEGLDSFLQWISTQRFTKIKVDLPIIFDKELEKDIVNAFTVSGFKKSDYIQDEETLVVSPKTFHLNKRNMRYVRKGMDFFEVVILEQLNTEELQSVYQLYVDSAHRIGFEPKTIDAMQRVAEGSITAVALHKETKEMCAFLMGFVTDFKTSLGRNQIMQLIFTGMNEPGQEAKIGFALHNQLFNYAFSEKQIAFIDFHGASRTKARSYVGFKQMFGGEFVALPGSYQKFIV